MSDERKCEKCGCPIKLESKTGVCRKCYPSWYKSLHKEQERANNQRWYAEHREEKRQKAKENYDPEYRRKWREKYYPANREKCKKLTQEWCKRDRAENPEKWKEIAKASNQKAKESGYKSAWYQENKERLQKEHKEYREKNREALNKKRFERYHSDVQFRLGQVLRSRLCVALAGDQKGGSAVRDLGCTISELKLYLESKFYPNPVTGETMSWDNWTMLETGWQIDHEKPMMDFDLTDNEQIKIVCHYSNLRPLWHQDHLQKTIEERKRSWDK